MKKYKIIYADPPWSYDDKLGSNSAKMGACEYHYKTMTIEDICNLPITKLSDDDSILFLWTTMPKLEEGLSVIKSWGFKYKTCAFTWIKTNPKANTIFKGIGRWVMGNAELCLLATKGHPHRITKNISQIVMAHRGKHSQKPDEVRNRIVQLMGDLPRIELFARNKTEGWTCLGNEINGKDIREELENLIK